ncbi:MAG: hypothetical protein WCV69_00275 [Patescibacteria group bacterium]|jgi:hypothetical protein
MNEKLPGREYDSTVPKNELVAKIENTNDFMLAIAAGQLAMAEEFLLAEKAKLEAHTDSGLIAHNENWLKNNFSILLSAYERLHKQEEIVRIMNYLPDYLRP